jgi:hypothetical protein
VVYTLDLPSSLAGVHDIFHVSQLKKCLKASSDVVLSEVTPHEADLSYPKRLIKVLDEKDHVCVGGHKMQIFTTNIPTFQSRYRR